ncbi:hypothetical protein [Streptomyces sp. L2]|uniref:hypothetical protein n=1 Tax=Streptomyces sp. L2 TaxID=2162665 RepID=UPI001F50D78B|nr:hypothetical protein [Streptomyces sp. L2]
MKKCVSTRLLTVVLAASAVGLSGTVRAAAAVPDWAAASAATDAISVKGVLGKRTDPPHDGRDRAEAERRKREELQRQQQEQRRQAQEERRRQQQEEEIEAKREAEIKRQQNEAEEEQAKNIRRKREIEETDRTSAREVTNERLEDLGARQELRDEDGLDITRRNETEQRTREERQKTAEEEGIAACESFDPITCPRLPGE